MYIKKKRIIDQRPKIMVDVLAVDESEIQIQVENDYEDVSIYFDLNVDAAIKLRDALTEFVGEEIISFNRLINFKLVKDIGTSVEEVISFNRLVKFSDIDNELNKAIQKHPDYPSDMFKQLAIMQEEAGEVTKAVLDYHSGTDNIEHIKKELMQTAAMCVRMLINIDKQQ